MGKKLRPGNGYQNRFVSSSSRIGHWKSKSVGPTVIDCERNVMLYHWILYIDYTFVYSCDFK